MLVWYFGPSVGIKEGSIAKKTQRIASLKVGGKMVGRVVKHLVFQLMERTNRWRFTKCLWKEKLLELSSVNQYWTLQTG
jgi:F0F1-type ATP synthase alpha subunit